MPIENASTATRRQGPRPDKKYFSVSEANRALPYVSRIIADVSRVYSRIVELRQQVEQSSIARERIEAAYEAEMDRLSGLVDELHAVGAELKDFEKGLVDFPAVHEGREILLCWHQGESDVAHWHETDAGYAARQPVDLLEPEPSTGR